MKPIFLLDRSFWFWILMAILAVALAGYLFHSYRALYAQNRETVAVQEEHPSFEDPHKKLTVVLRQLEADFPEPHHHSVNFYTLLGDAFRNYFEEVYRFQAMESISREVLGYLAHIHRDKKILSLAGKIFHKADQVKFARLRPGKRECKNILKQAWKFAGMLEEADRERIDMMRREFEQKPLPDSAQEETKNDLG